MIHFSNIYSGTWILLPRVVFFVAFKGNRIENSSSNVCNDSCTYTYMSGWSVFEADFKTFLVINELMEGYIHLHHFRRL